MGLAGMAMDAFYASVGLYPRTAFNSMSANEARPRAEILAQQAALLQRTLQLAATKVPYYRERGLAAEISAFPVLRKELLDAHFAALIVEGGRRKGDRLASGSGTTRVATRLLIDKESYSWHNAVRWRIASWHGCPPGTTSVLFAQERRKPPLREIKERFGEHCVRRYRLQMLRQDEASVRQVQAQLCRIRPAVVDGMTSILESFCHFCTRLKLPPPPGVRLVRPSGENITDQHRQAFADYFQAPVRATYGAREFGTVAGECREGRYHLSPEINYYEVLRDDGSIGTTGSGRILVTTLHNSVMPLIRYDPGDFVTLTDEPCPCGLPLPVLAEIHGRTSELFYLPDGSTISSRAMYVLFEYRNLHMWRVTQDGERHLAVELVPTSAWDGSDEAAIRRGLDHVTGGQLRYDFAYLPRIEALPNGKNPKVVNLTEKRY